MTPQFPSPLHFPSQQAIATYLGNHPLTDGSDSRYLKTTEPKLNALIIKVVSKALAEKEITPGVIRVWVERAIDAETAITLPNDSRIWVIQNLTFALQQCARGDPIMRFSKKIKTPS